MTAAFLFGVVVGVVLCVTFKVSQTEKKEPTP
jgi:hypothetical protein